ncbi:hypothetical protein I317_07935 [Kwoniella heveanensis CBS 569]|nr:hypothetical protein I317_07935 [Kwoniella heveanensis CBS 569]
MSNPNIDDEGFAIPAIPTNAVEAAPNANLPPAKKQLRPTASLPTTTETYGEKHGISPDLQAALQSVGRRGRQNVAMGHATHRAFERTQSFPAHVLSNSSTPNTGFQTALDAFAHAQGIINKEALRAKELQPFYSSALGSGSSSDVDGLSLSPRGANRRLKFGADGEVEEEELEGGNGQLFPGSGLGQGRALGKTREEIHLTAARKRRSSPAEPTSDTETEIGDDDEAEHDTQFSGSAFTNHPSGLGSYNHSGVSDFPPVFKSPAMTHPELFGNTAATSRAFPSAFKGVNAAGARELRGLPGARKIGFGKTMSAPVGQLGGSGGWGVDVDMGTDNSDGGGAGAVANGGGEDGFDIKDWAENEQF